MDVMSTYLHSIFAAVGYAELGGYQNSQVTIQSLDDSRILPTSSASWLFNDLGWSIADQQPNDAAGFSATLFSNGDQKVLAIRGTETDNIGQAADDLLQADLGEIRLDGMAISQAVSLFNYVQRLRADEGSTGVLQLTLHAGPMPPASATCVTRDPTRLDRYVWLEAAHTGTGLGLLDANDEVTVTGHSLGGHLAALTLRLFPDVFSEAYTFNAPGFDPTATSDGLTDELIALFNPYLTPDAAAGFGSIASRIHTIESEGSAPGDDIDLISSDVTGAPPSAETYVSTENNSHSVGHIVDALAAQGLLADIDPTLTIATLDRIYRATSRIAGATDERLVESLSRLVLGDDSTLPVGETDGSVGNAPFDTRTALHNRISAVRERAVSLDGVAVRSLVDAAGSDTATLARTEVGYRYALAAAQPFALTGSDALYAGVAADGALDRYDSANRTGTLTDAWIDDRAHFVRQALARNVGDQAMITDAPGIAETYVDLASGEAFSTVAVGHVGPDLPPDSVRLVFGSARSESLTGGNADDRLYAGAGDDLLDGGRGSDYLEGGKGFDLYQLRSGEGVDRIIDVDGEGRIQLDGSQPGVGFRIGDGLYLGGGDRMVLALDGEDPTQDGTLIVDGGVRIEHFRTGDLGVTLQMDGRAEAPRSHALAGGDRADALSIEDVEELLGTAVPLDASLCSDGGAGNDWLVTVNGGDLVYGGGGDDLVSTGDGDDRIDAGDGADMVFSGPGSDLADGGAGDDLLFGNQYLLYDTSGTARGDARAWEDLGGALAWRNDGLHQSDDGLLEVRVHVELPQSAIAGLSTQQGLTFRYDPVSGDIAYFNEAGELVETVRQQAHFAPWANDGAKRYAGGTGDDVLAGATGADVLHGGADDDWLAGNDGDDLLLGGTGDDLLLGGRGGDHLDGGAGGDTLIGEDGADHLFGGEGNDAIFGDSDSRSAEVHGDDRLHGGAGDDELAGHGGNDMLSGDDGEDLLWGGDGRDALRGGAGADHLQGGNGDDRLDGGLDADALFGEAGADLLCGGDADDALCGGADDDTLSGDSGRDTLGGNGGNDTYLFHWGDGLDYLEDVDGATTLTFGTGIAPADLRLYAMDDGSLFVAYGGDDGLQVARDSVAGIACATFATGERLDPDALFGNHVLNAVSAQGTEGADVLRGGVRSDWLSGEGGDDTLVGGSGDDRLNGQGGNDILRGGTGADELDGGDGDDLLAGGPGDDVLRGGSGADAYLIESGSGKDTLGDTGEEQTADVVRFGAGIAAADLRFLRRPDGALEVEIGASGDRLTLPDWYDRPRTSVSRFELADGTVIVAAELLALDVAPQDGTAGNDVLRGTEFADRLRGGDGDDLLDGGRGDDHLAGGAGDDRYALGRSSGMDRVEDTGRNAVQLSQGLWLSELERERDGDDLLLRIRGARDTGLRIEGFYSDASDWRILTDDGAAHPILDVAEASWWGSAADPTAAAKADYLAERHADLSAWMADEGYVRLDADTYRIQPVGATLESSSWETRQSTVDYASGTIYEWVNRYSSPPRVRQVEYAGGREESAYHLADDTLRFEVVAVPMAGQAETRSAIVFTTESRVQTTIGFSPTATETRLEAPEEHVRVSSVGSLLEGGYSGVRLETQTTLISTTRTEGTLGGTGTATLPLTVTTSRFRVERYVGSDGDDDLTVHRSSHGIVEGGAGNDRLSTGWGWAWDTSGLFYDGGAGSDVVDGSDYGDVVAGGAGSDRLDGGGGADVYVVDPAQRGIDLVEDRAVLHGDYEVGWSSYKVWYLESIGYDASDAYSALLHGPDLPTIPRIDATDYGTIETLIGAGLIETDEIAFGTGVTPSALTVSWGYHEVLGSSSGLRATLNLSWGPDQGVRIVMPAEPLPDEAIGTERFYYGQPDWLWVEGGAGAGIERFRFGDDLVLTAAEMIALAPEAPLHPSEALRSVNGTDADDSLDAGDHAGRLAGMAGDDHLSGSATADVLAGGAGNDLLAGGAGGDLYRFDSGDGADVIVESGAATADLDVVQLGEGLVPADTAVVRSGNDLVLRFGEGADRLTVRDWFLRADARIEQIVFADGWLWDGAEIGARAVVENQAPVAVDPPAAAVAEGEALGLALPAATFIDPDGDSLVLSATLAGGEPIPSWLSFDAQTATLSGTPPLDASGSYHVVLTATDPLGASAQAELTLDVRDVNPPIIGGVAGETLTGTAYPEVLDGGAGDDRLFGGAGDDTLVGGEGRDVLDGGDGDDILHFSGDTSWASADGPVAHLTSHLMGIDSAALMRERSSSLDTYAGGAGTDTLAGSAGSDAVLLTRLDSLGTPRITGVERFELGAGDDLLVLTGLFTTYGDVDASGGDGDDSLWTSSGADRLDGGAGADDLHGGAGQDTLFGAGGGDVLDGGLGADRLDGGTDDDMLQGGRGADAYVYRRGDGADHISETGPTREADRLELGSGLGPDELWLARSGDDLVLRVLNDTGSVTIDGWYTDESRQIERIETADGLVLLAADVDRLVDAMSTFGGGGAGESLTALTAIPALAPVIAAAWQPAHV
jgi:Ca2+-binding RTX toxin-like protein